MVGSRSWLLPAALLLGCLEQAAAQTSSDCNPMTNTSCPVDPAFGTDYLWTFNTTSAPSTKEWTTTAGEVEWTSNGANFNIEGKGDSPTIRTEFYIFGGRVEIWMKAAAGQGIISSIMLLSDDLDEIDLEFLGGNGTAVQTNFFGKGHNNYTWESDFNVDGGTTADYHNYTIDWKEDSLDWYIDGEHKRHLTPDEANSTYSYPQTPMRLYIGPWAGGDPDNAQGTIEWAGGETDYDEGPFTMAVQQVRVTDYGRGTAYNYTDSSGTWDSIQMLNTDKNSTAAKSVNEPPEKSLSEKWADLPSSTRTAVYAVIGVAAASLTAAALWFCYRQRRRGIAEAQQAARQHETERLEMDGYKAAGIDPDGFGASRTAAGEYDAATGMVVEKGVGRPLLDGQGGHGRAMSLGSPPGTPQGQAMAADPYADGFSPIDHHGGGGFGSMTMPGGAAGSPTGPAPTGPLPAVPGAAQGQQWR